MPRNANIWQHNTNEIYINTDPEKQAYFHPMFDSGGNQYDAVRTAELGTDESWNGEWRVRCTINYNISWTALVRIPFSDLGATPNPGDRWTLNITRGVQSGGMSSWSLSPGTWHAPDAFGDLVVG